MDTETVFLNCIRHEPADDTVRLAYADYLTERASEERRDAERARLIRAQIALENFAHHDEVRTGRYDARDGISAEWQAAFDHHDTETDLLGRYQDLWLSEPFWVERGNHRWRWWRRGFVDTVHTDLQTLTGHLDAIARQPLSRIRLTDRIPHPCGPIVRRGVDLPAGVYWHSSDAVRVWTQAVPDWICKHLADSDLSLHARPRYYIYPTPAAAHEDLDRAVAAAVRGHALMQNGAGV